MKFSEYLIESNNQFEIKLVILEISNALHNMYSDFVYHAKDQEEPYDNKNIISTMKYYLGEIYSFINKISHTKTTPADFLNIAQKIYKKDKGVLLSEHFREYLPANVYHIKYDIDPETIKYLLINQANIREYSKVDYDQFVKNHFFNNTILINKWIKYGESIRNEV